MEQRWLSKRWKAKSYRLRAFVRAQGKWFSIIGALIVFSTFVVKDYLREGLKETVASIDSAESVFLIRDSEREVLSKLVVVEQTIDDARKGTTTSTADDDYQRSMKFIEDESTFFVELDSLYRLIERLPPNTERNEQMNQFGKYLFDLRGSEVKFGGDLINGRRTSESGHDHTIRVARELKEQNFRLDMFAATVVEQAKVVKEHEEHEFKIASVFSTALYIFGWGLAFVGKLYRVDGAGSE